jgi:hypothetical protein
MTRSAVGAGLLLGRWGRGDVAATVMVGGFYRSELR